MSASSKGHARRRGGVAVILAFSFIFFSSTACAVDWKEEKGDHFIVYYADNPSFAQQIRRQAEVYYNRIASDLGYARVDNFWQWDKRVKIWVYPTEKEFQAATGNPGWAKGVANYDRKEITTFAWSEGFTDALLPHEIAHLIFRDFVGFKGQVPLWLDEGVAQWEEPAKRAVAKEVARYLLANRKAFSIRQLTTMDVRGSADEELVQAFYMQAVTLVEFLIKAHGPRVFTEFCRGLRDGKSLDQALRSAYPESLNDQDKVEARWKKYVLSG